jgi:peptide/nickel transport system permease protein
MSPAPGPSAPSPGGALVGVPEALPAAVGPRRRAVRRVRENRSLAIGAGIVLAFVVIALLAPVLAPEDPRAQNLSAIGATCCDGPSSAHPLGVDDLGRDVLSRLLYGARVSLLIGLVAVTVGLVVGVVVGGIAGYAGRVVDMVVMRFVDLLLAIPSLLLAIGIVAALGPGLVQITIAVGVTTIPVFARLMRSSILAQRNAEYVTAARAIGVPAPAILVRHILPNSLSPVAVQATLATATAIIDVAGLGFLGLGPQDPSTPEWGSMLTGAVRYLGTAPHLAVFPGIAIVLAVLGFSLLGDGLRDAADPRTRAR